MSIIEHIIGVIAPHQCLGCGVDGHVLCAVCACQLPMIESSTGVGTGYLAAAARYEGTAKRLVHALKFERAQAAAEDIAAIMAARLPTGAATVVTYVPTATSRVRQRGYDQARLIAMCVAKELGLPCRPLLSRQGQARQVGQSKVVRMRQLEGAFHVRGDLTDEHVMLIDDVLTTGATTRAGAAVLYEAGAARVDIAVFAKATQDLE